MAERNTTYEDNFRKYLFKGDIDRYRKILKRINVLQEDKTSRKVRDRYRKILKRINILQEDKTSRKVRNK